MPMAKAAVVFAAMRMRCECSTRCRIPSFVQIRIKAAMSKMQA